MTLVFAVIVLASIYFLFASAKTERAPTEDQGVVITQSVAAPNATLQQRQMYSRQVYNILCLASGNRARLPARRSRPIDRRHGDETLGPARATTNTLQPIIQQEVGKVAGVRIAAFQPPALPGSFGLPIQFVIVTTEPFERLNTVAQQFLQQSLAGGMFIFLDCDLKIDNPQSNVIIDRDKTAQLGLKMSDVGSSLTCSQTPMPADPAPSITTVWSRSRDPVAAAPAKRAARTTAAVPWMSSLKLSS